MMVPRNPANAAASADRSGRELLRVLAVGVRLEIIASLIDGEHSVSALAKALRVDERRLPTDLRQLLQHGMLQRRRQGRLQMYRLTEIVNAKLSGRRLGLTITDPARGSILLEISMQLPRTLN
ncbi:MAG: hypothetical protein V3T53_06430 [Phycisphaerales bacterium]